MQYVGDYEVFGKMLNFWQKRSVLEDLFGTQGSMPLRAEGAGNCAVRSPKVGISN